MKSGFPTFGHTCHYTPALTTASPDGMGNHDLQALRQAFKFNLIFLLEENCFPVLVSAIQQCKSAIIIPIELLLEPSSPPLYPATLLGQVLMLR